MAWVKEPPYVPAEGYPSVYYWYYDLKDNTMWPAEIYKGCWKLHGYDGLWWDKPISPPNKPSLESSKDVKGKTKSNIRRHRVTNLKEFD